MDAVVGIEPAANLVTDIAVAVFFITLVVNR